MGKRVRRVWALDNKMDYSTFSAILLISAILGAYTSRFQEATRYWGNKLSSFNQSGMQDAITSKYQNLRNIIFIASIVFSLLGGWVIFEWYIGFIALIAIFLTVGIFRAFLPLCNSDFFYKKIMKNLYSKLEYYKNQNDSLRLNACQQVIERLKNENKNT